ncbi:MAG: hypothetical protein ACJ8LG_17595, partial [Massilia sp.]
MKRKLTRRFYAMRTVDFHSGAPVLASTGTFVLVRVKKFRKRLARTVKRHQYKPVRFIAQFSMCSFRRLEDGNSQKI